MTAHMAIAADVPLAETHVLEIGDAPRHLLEGYHAGFGKTFLRAPENFSWIPYETLMRPDRVLAVRLEAGTVVAGLYVDRIEENGRPTAYFKGLFSNAATRGLAGDMIRSTLAYERHVRGQDVGALAVIRLRADGSANPAAAKVLARLGFHPRSYVRVPLTTSEEHRHLIPTANQIDEDGAAFDVLEMVMSPSDVGRLIGR